MTDPDRPEVVVVDIDGVVADPTHRLHHLRSRPKDWDAFFDAADDDPPLAPGLAAVHAATAAGRTVVWLSGRPQRCRRATVRWLARHGLPARVLHLRRPDDRRPAARVKLEVVTAISERYAVVDVLDDDPDVVDALRTAGHPATLATWLPRDDSLGGAQRSGEV